MNIRALISATLEWLVEELVLSLKDVGFIEKLKNEYLAMIAVSQLLLLVVDVQIMLEAIMLSNIITDCGLKLYTRIGIIIGQYIEIS